MYPNNMEKAINIPNDYLAGQVVAHFWYNNRQEKTKSELHLKENRITQRENSKH